MKGYDMRTYRYDERNLRASTVEDAMMPSKDAEIMPFLRVSTNRDAAREGIVTMGKDDKDTTRLTINLQQGEVASINSFNGPLDHLKLVVNGAGELRVAQGCKLGDLVLNGTTAMVDPLRSPAARVTLHDHAKATIADAGSVILHDYSEGTVTNEGGSILPVAVHDRALVMDSCASHDRPDMRDRIVRLYDHGSAVVSGPVQVDMQGHSRADVFDHATAVMHDAAQANLYDHAAAQVYDESYINALDQSSANVHDNGIATPGEPTDAASQVDAAYWPEGKRGRQHTAPDPSRFIFHGPDADDPSGELQAEQTEQTDPRLPIGAPSVRSVADRMADRLAAKAAALNPDDETQPER